MASKAASFADICPVCLETRPLKIVARCKHRFCEECLTITLGSQKGDVFSCPTCKVECPRPLDGVKGMVAFTGKDVAVVDSVVKTGRRRRKKGKKKAGVESEISANQGKGLGLGNQEKTKDGKLAGITMDVKCTICFHKKKDVQAVNMCVECGNLYICEECSAVHARNKATQKHVVVRLRPETKKREGQCEDHDSTLNSYCDDCGKAVCMVCVMLVHGEHTVEKLDDVVDAGIETLGNILEEREKEIRKLQGLKCELTVLQGETTDLDKQDILIREIEDHAQKCIDHVIKWKEGLKGKVKMCFSIVRDIHVDFKKVSDVIEKLQKQIDHAAKLLATTDRRQINLNELITLQQDLKATADLGGDLQRSGHLHQLRALKHDDFSFSPDEINTSFGTVDRKAAMPLMGEVPVEIFKQTIPAASEDMFIPSVANLGKMFAVASPTREDAPAVAIDIYEFPGTLKHTLTDHVPPLYDMSSTPDGKIAVLSDGTGGSGCSIKLFDPDTGYISCTRDIGIVEPSSLDVTIRHQYVILGDDELGQSVITVVDRDGVVEHTLVIDEDFNQEDVDSDADSDENVDQDTEGEFYEATDADDDFDTHVGIDTYSNVAAGESNVAYDANYASDSDSDGSTDIETYFEQENVDVDSDENVDETEDESDEASHHADYASNTRTNASYVAADIPDRIACGGEFIFVLGDETVAVYEITNTEIQNIEIKKNFCSGGECTDISATIWDDYFVSFFSSDVVWLQEWVKDNVNMCEWGLTTYHTISGLRSGDERPARISVRDGHVVVCQGQTIRVFKIKE